jgi:hypothetical protein
MSSITTTTSLTPDEKLQITKKDLIRTNEIASNTIQRMKKLQIRLAQSLNRLDKQMENARDAVDSAFYVDDEDDDTSNDTNDLSEKKMRQNNTVDKNNAKSSSTMNFSFVQKSLHVNKKDQDQMKQKPISRLSIAMLIRNPPITALHTFITHHLNIGFEKFYFFFDDIIDDILKTDKDAMVTLQSTYPNNVVVIQCTSEWYLNFSFDGYKKYIYTDLVARQIVAVKQALKIANRDGMNWLLHIDIDELLCFDYSSTREDNDDNNKSSSSRTINDWFRDIPSHIDQIRFINYEAAPETIELATNNYFNDITLFKPNPSIVKKSLLRQFWPIKERPYFFTAYSNGKSAVRCDMKQTISLNGAHSFCFESKNEEILSVDAADIDIINGNNSKDNYKSPIILHYPHSSYKLWLDKYKRLGNFPSIINGKDEIPSNSFHIKSRNIVAGNAKSDDFEQEKIFFSNSVIFLNECEVDKLLSHGLLVRVYINC